MTAPTAVAPGPVPSRQRLLISSSALFWGLQFAFLNPSIGLILVALYGASPAEVGFALAAYNLSGFLSTLAMPARADRSGDYLTPMLWCGLFTIALVTALALSTTLPLAVLSLVALGGPAGVGMSLLFAYQRSAGGTVRELMRSRAMLSVAWVAGPPLATLLIGLLGKRSILWAVVGIALVSLGLTQALRAGRARSGVVVTPGAGTDTMSAALRRPHVLLLLVTFIALQAPIITNASVMSLFITQELGRDVLWAGAALGTTAALEIPLFAVLGRCSERIGPRRLVAIGGLAGLVYFLAVPWAGSPGVLIGLQVLNAFYIATISGIGLTLFQDTIDAPGLASGLFMNTGRIGAILAGPAVAVGGATSFGYGATFLACALLCALGVALVGVGYLRRVSRRRARVAGR